MGLAGAVEEVDAVLLHELVVVVVVVGVVAVLTRSHFLRDKGLDALEPLLRVDGKFVNYY